MHYFNIIVHYYYCCLFILFVVQLFYSFFVRLLFSFDSLLSFFRYSLFKRKIFGEPAISHDSHHVSLVQWTNLFASHHKGPRFKSPGGYLCETGILLLAMARYRYLILILDCILGISILLYNCTRIPSPSMQVNKHHISDCTDFVLV